MSSAREWMSSLRYTLLMWDFTVFSETKSFSDSESSESCGSYTYLELR